MGPNRELKGLLRKRAGAGTLWGVGARVGVFPWAPPPSRSFVPLPGFRIIRIYDMVDRIYQRSNFVELPIPARARAALAGLRAGVLITALVRAALQTPRHEGDVHDQRRVKD